MNLKGLSRFSHRFSLRITTAHFQALRAVPYGDQSVDFKAAPVLSTARDSRSAFGLNPVAGLSHLSRLLSSTPTIRAGYSRPASRSIHTAGYVLDRCMRTIKRHMVHLVLRFIRP